MKFVYWGTVNSGSHHIHQLLSYNKHRHIDDSCNSAYTFDKYIYVDDIIGVTSHYKSNKFEGLVEHTRSEKPKYETWSYKEYYNFIDDRILEKKPYKNVDPDILEHYIPFLDQPPDTWQDLVLDKISDCVAINRMFHLLGYVNHERKYNTTPKIISFLKTYKNIVPYKTNLVDSMISKLNLFDPPKQSKKYTNKTGRPVFFKTILDAYNRDKNIVWSHLDDFTRQQRNIEQLLLDLNIPFEYFNLDEDSYKDVFELEGLPRDKTHPKFKHNDNWNIIKNMAEEYIDIRKLQDPRLYGRIKDKI
tara:strand:+ start:279 stop:1187 length:909 start_codon:yes stop_codon:yes gene_type:complete